MIEFLGTLLNSNLARVIAPLLLTSAAAILGLRLVSIVNLEAERRVNAAYVDEYDRRARLMTLLRTAVTSMRALIITVALLITLSTIGIDIAPVLTAAGIVGLALSLGTQTLVKDILGGLIILLEDQYRVGDVITVGDVSGEVEQITLRRTDIRDINGRLHIVANGDVRAVGNDTRDWSRSLIEINLAFDSDVTKAVEALESAMARATADPEAGAMILEPPEIFGWNQFSDWAVTVRLRAKVKPGTQWQVSRVLRRCAMESLRAAGMTIESRMSWQMNRSG